MMNDDAVEFDGLLAVALAQTADARVPGVEVKKRLLTLVTQQDAPAGFDFRFKSDPGFIPHPVPGIMMKVLAMNRAAGYATLLLDVAPGTRFPEHHHTGAEECFVLSGSLYTCNRKLSAGDFLHADGHTDHGELYTEEGCSVLLVVPPEDYMPDPAARA